MGNRLGLVIAFAIAVIGVSALVFLAFAGQRLNVQTSILGVRGLETLLRNEDISVVKSSPRALHDATSLSMAIIPLYAPIGIEPAEDSELYPLSPWVYTRKISVLPSVILLPKWTETAAETGIVAEPLLFPPESFGRTLSEFDIPTNAILRKTGLHTLEAGSMGGASVFSPQFFHEAQLPETCNPLLGKDRQVLMIGCSKEDVEHITYLVSDPDLMNNHGLSLGENADLAIGLIKAVRPDLDLPLYIDTEYSVNVQTARASEYQPYERDRSAFMRFFSYPFTVIWACALILFAALIWRGQVRFGPIETRDVERLAHSKTVSINATADLLRLAGHNGHVARTFAKNRIEQNARHLFGTLPGRNSVELYFKALARENPKAATRYREAYCRLINLDDGASDTEISSALSNFQSAQEALET